MIAIDTNVLLRYLLDDDVIQSRRAEKLILGDQSVLVTDVVLTEAIWTLKGKRYNLNKEAIANVILHLFDEPNICFEDGQVVWQSLCDFREAKPANSGKKRKEADFPDALIVNKARFIANERNIIFKGVYTFDVAAQQIQGANKP